MALFSKKGAAQPAAPEIAPPTPAPVARTDRPRAGYGIEDAIRLMRSLPVDQNADLVVRVIKTTLESVNVHLPEIIGDAARKQQMLEERLAELRGEIAGLEAEIETRRKEIAAVDTDLSETTRVKQRLEAVERGGAAPALFPPAPPPPPRKAPTARPVSEVPKIETQEVEPEPDEPNIVGTPFD